MDTTPEELDTTNKFGVAGSSAKKILIMFPPLRGELTYEDALLLAAYLVAMSEPFVGYKFEDILNAVRST